MRKRTKITLSALADGIDARRPRPSRPVACVKAGTRLMRISLATEGFELTLTRPGPAQWAPRHHTGRGAEPPVVGSATG
jgi:hypothetical protein